MNINYLAVRPDRVEGQTTDLSLSLDGRGRG
jgi:hypothetical protein